MRIEWRKNKNFKPHIVLKEIEKAMFINSSGDISFRGEEYFESMDMLENMITFPDGSYGVEPYSLLSEAITNILKKPKKLTNNELIEEVNEVLKNSLSIKETKYFILTSISLSKPYPQKIIAIENCRIRILEYGYPKKYSGRGKLIKDHFYKKEATPLNYAKVIVTVKAKSEHSAVTKALRVLDIQRAIWCLFANPWKEITSKNRRPINKIRLGEIHTLHQDNGKDSSSRKIWYDPTFIEENPFSPFDYDLFRKNSKWVLLAINKNPYSNKIIETLLRMVRALDERDHNVALLKLWGALETLASPNSSNYGYITKRVAFIFQEYHYHKQVLEYLRDNRNKNVHAGDESDKARNNCYKLQFYLKELVLFHLGQTGNFHSLEEANSFLELSPSKEVLERKLFIVKKAIKFST